MSQTNHLYRLGCGMTAPEFSADHAHEMGCFEAVSVDFKAAKRAYEDAPVPIRVEDFVRRIVDAALGGGSV